MIFSYSRLTIENMKNTCKQYIDCELFTEEKLIMTIDAFSYNIISKILPEEACAVNVLSSKLLELIQTRSEDVKKRLLKPRSKYNDLKMLFVDEAQDLNETQYKIICFIKEITGCSVHLVGDPN